MDCKNQRGQIVMEFIMIALLFTAMFSAIHLVSQQQKEQSNKYKISRD